MITHILIQIWNKRRANVWIFLELVLVAFFMWGVIDPIYVLLSNRTIEKGYDTDNVFRLCLGEYSSGDSRFSEAQHSDSLRRVAFDRIYGLVKQYPGVESAVVTQNSQYPYTRVSNGWNLKQDSLSTFLQVMTFYQDGEFFKVFRMQEVNTGMIPDHRLRSGREVYLTKDAARKLSPDKEITGTRVYNAHGKDSVGYTVVGVMPKFKVGVAEQPSPFSFVASEKLDIEDFPYSAQLCFRIREGLSPQVFAEQFKKELAPQLSIGNLYFLTLTEFDTIRHHWEVSNGTLNKLRLQTGLTFFFLLCTFLGIAGTFWIRSDARKGEIGLRMALGSSRKNILKEFLTESWLLTTVAWAIGIFFVLQRVYYTGFAEPPRFRPGDLEYLQNRFIPHFLIVSGIVYILMLLTTIVGTWIPARQAAATYPAEALRDE